MSDTAEMPLEEEGGEFLNLDDPNLEILDDAEPARESGSDAESNNGDELKANTEPEEELANEAEDLNVVPDVEPLRDDAFQTFEDPKHKPFHAVAAHPSDPLLFAVSGEAEVIYVLRASDPARFSGSGSEAELTEVQLVQTLTGHTDTVSLLSFSPNGEWLASGSLDATVALWSTKTWERVHSFTDLYGEMMSLLWHPSSLLLVASCDDAQAAMWNVLKGTVVMFFAGHRDAVTTTQWSADVKKLITGSSDGTVSVFNPKTGVQEISITKDLSADSAGVTALCVLSSDQCLVGCEDGTLHVVSLRNGKVVQHLEEIHEQAIESIQYNATLNLIVTSSCDCKVLVWSAADFTPRTAFDAHESVIPCIWCRNDIYAGCSDGKVRVWDGRSSEGGQRHLLDGHRRMIFQLVFSPSANLVVSASDDGTAKFFDLRDLATDIISI